MIKRIFSLLLALLLCLSLASPALAGEEAALDAAPETAVEVTAEAVETEETAEEPAEAAAPEEPAPAVEAPEAPGAPIMPEAPVSEEEPAPAADGAKWVKVSTDNFPDEVFYAVVSQFLDTDGDGWLSEAEIAAVTELCLDYDPSRFPHYISKLQGIEYFTALEVLSTRRQLIYELDISKNTKLTYLDICRCSLKALDLHANTALIYLDCSENCLSSLDLSQNKALEYLDCNHCNLASLDLSACPELFTLYCQNNRITDLDISANPQLIDIFIESISNVSDFSSGSGSIQYGFEETNEEDGTTQFVAYLRFSPILTLYWPDMWLSGQCGDDAAWTLKDDVMTITGTGAIWYLAQPKWCNLPIRTVVVEDDITEIGKRSFCGCTAIRQLELNDGVTSIGQEAFSHCHGLTDLTLPASVKKIGYDAFANCFSLKSVLIHCDPEEVGPSIFRECTALESVVFAPGVKRVPEGICSNCANLRSVTLADSVEAIGFIAFFYCPKLCDVTLGSGLKTIGDSAFAKCAIKEIRLPEGLETIGDSAFSACQSLTDVRLPSSLTKIGSRAFAECLALRDVSIGPGVVSIGNSAFWQCPGITAFHVDAGNPAYASPGGVLYNKNLTELIQYPGAKPGPYVIPDSVKAIDQNAFNYATGLTELTLPENTTACPRFDCCSALTSLTIPVGITKLDFGTFNDCSALTDLYYGGTEKQWANMELSWDVKAVLKNAAIHFAPPIPGDEDGDRLLTPMDAALILQAAVELRSNAAGYTPADAASVLRASAQPGAGLTSADKKASARSLIEWDVSELYAAIGQPESTSYEEMGVVQMGTLIYPGFTVSTVIRDGAETVYEVY